MELTVDLHHIWDKTKQLLLKPNRFFKSAKKEKGWKEAFTYLLIIALVGHVLTAIYSLIFYPALVPIIKQFLPEISNEINSQPTILFLAVDYVVTLAMCFVWAAGLKILLSVFKEDSTFDQAYKTIVYSRTPIFLFKWVPVANILISFYSLYLLVLALRTEYSITSKKAILVTVTGIVAMFLFSILILLIAYKI